MTARSRHAASSPTATATKLSTARTSRHPARRLASPLAAAIFAALYPAAATLAQEHGDRSPRIEEIVVTATRREANLQDVAQSIAAFSTADIEKQGFEDMEDYIKALPSVNLVNSMPGRNAVVMRGISTGSAEYRTDSQVAVYLDEQPMTSISQQVDVRLIDIARIEALPGPQGTLFGSSSQSGTLRIITNKPDPSEFSAQLDAEFSSTKGGEESYDFSGHVNIPLIDDKLAVRVVGFVSREGGYVDNVLGRTLLGDRDNADVVEEDWNDYDTTGGRIAARWSISDDWETTLSLVAQQSDANGAWETDPALGDYKITRFFDEYRDDYWYQTSINVQGDLGFAVLSATASYFDRDIAYEWDNMTYEQWKTAYWGPFYPLYDSDYTFGTIFNDQKQNRWAYEVRLTSLGESRFQWMVGAFYEDVYDWWFYGAKNPDLTSTTAWEAAQYYAYWANYYGYDVEYPLPPTNIGYSNLFDKTIKQTAVFAETTFALTDRWSVTGGVRWFEYDREEVDIYEFPGGLPVFGAYDTGGADPRTGTATDTVFKLGTEYHFNDDLMAYALYSEGFRLGGNNSTRAAATGEVPLEYGPDKLHNYELGMKSEWWDRRLQLNVALFYMQWDGIQLNVSDGVGPWWLRGTFNGKTAEQKGVELNGIVQATDNLGFEASVFLGDPEFSERAKLPNDDVIRKGFVIPISPDEKYSLAAEYTIPSIRALNGDLRFRYDYSYQSETWNSLDSVIANDRGNLVPSWSSSNLQVGFTHDSDWVLTLMVRNLFDERNINWLSSVTSEAELFGDPRYHHLRSLQRPRTISLGFRKKF